MTEPIEDHRPGDDEPSVGWASPTGASGTSAPPEPDPTPQGGAPIRVTLPPGIRPIWPPGSTEAPDAASGPRWGNPSGPAPSWDRPGAEPATGPRAPAPAAPASRHPAWPTGASGPPGGYPGAPASPGPAGHPSQAWSGAPGASAVGGRHLAPSPQAPVPPLGRWGTQGPGGWPAPPVGTGGMRAPSGLFPSGPPRPTYREPFTIRSSAVLIGAGAGALWMLLFGLLASTGRAYAWLTISSGALAWLTALALARMGDRGVAVGVAVSSAVGVAIAGIVILARLVGGHWLLW